MREKQYDNYYTGHLEELDPVHVFEPPHIILIQDGQCASTCAIFTEFMKTQVGVKQIVFGGRSQHGPMQGVGGTKGAQVYKYDDVLDYLTDAFKTDPVATLAAGVKQSLDIDATYELIDNIQHAINRTAKDPVGKPLAGVNARNNLRANDTTLTPLQFVYEAADCRRFYTPEMITSQQHVWLAAYDAIWADGGCVANSTSHPSSRPGTDYILSSPDDLACVRGETGECLPASKARGKRGEPTDKQDTSDPPDDLYAPETETLTLGDKINIGWSGGLTILFILVLCYVTVWLMNSDNPARRW